ncbi:MAG: O-antigen ligase family protein [bacterium]|nr:O-antigen ligase family protein [bacterium]
MFAALLLAALAAQLSVAIGQLALGLALLAALVRVASRRDRPARTGLELPFLLLLFWALAMIPVSEVPHEGLRNARRFFLFVPLWLGAGYVVGERRRWAVLAAVALGATINAVYSVLVESVIPGDYAHRIGMIQHSVITSSWLVMSASLLAGAVVLLGPGGRLRLAAALVLAPLLVAVALTQSRSAWLGTAAGFALMTACARPRLILPLILVAAAGFALSPAHLRDRLQSVTDPAHATNAQRLALWRAGLVLVREHPITGVGDRNLAPLTPALVVVPGAAPTAHVRHLHQNFLMLAAIWGVPGLVFGTWFLLGMGWRLGRRWRELRVAGVRAPPARLIWALGGLGVWVGVVVTGFFDWSFGDPELGLVYLLAVGVALAPGTARDPLARDAAGSGTVQA